METLLPKRGATRKHALPSMSETEFVAWYEKQDECTHAEWVDGEVQIMSPENTQHNKILFFLASLIGDYAGEGGDVMGDGVQVRLHAIRRRREADVIFVSRSRSQIVKATHIDGPPDILIEIVSPDSVTRDYHDKFLEYQEGGVKEYWIVDPLSERIEAYTLGPGKHYVPLKRTNGKINSKVLRGFYIKPEWLWQQPLPTRLKILDEMGVR